MKKRLLVVLVWLSIVILTIAFNHHVSDIVYWIVFSVSALNLGIALAILATHKK